MASVLVTGGTGFLGGYILLQLLEKGYAVKALRRSQNLPEHIDAALLANVQWINGDILDVVSLQEAMQDVDYIIHSAAIVSFAKKDKAQMMKINVEGTANVVNMALDSGVKKLVYISSVAALGRTLHGETVSEEKKWEENKLTTNYAKSKNKAELEVWRGMAEGLEAVILNPSTILGFGDWNTGSSAIFKNVYKEFPWFSRGMNGFVDVDDVAKAAVLLMEADVTEQRFIINGDNWTFKNLLDTIAQALGKKPPHKEATPFIAGLAWRMAWLKAKLTGGKAFLTKESARVAQSNTSFTNKKILAALPGFSFTPLAQTIANAGKKYLLLAAKKV